MTRALEKTFRDQFLRYAQQAGWEDGSEGWVHRREAERILIGVPKKLIPTDRRGMLCVRYLAFLCAALDDARIEARPGCVTMDEIHIAWDLAARTAPPGLTEARP